jgi:hypothetical protein
MQLEHLAGEQQRHHLAQARQAFDQRARDLKDRLTSP